MEFFAKLLAFWIPGRKRRKAARRKLLNWMLSRRVRKSAASVGRGLRVGGPSAVGRNTHIGDFVSLNGVHVHGSGKVTIGSYTRIGTETLILSQNHNYDTGSVLPFDPETYIAKDVEIGECVWIGARALILPGAKIGDGAVIQAGAVVHGEIPPCAIAGGNPAKVFAWRDKTHYDELKARGAFIGLCSARNQS